jgi:hypothetical protein
LLSFPASSRLSPPSGPSKVDLARRSERASPGADRSANHRPFKGRTNHEAADGTDACADPGAAQGAIARGLTTAGQRDERHGSGC